MQHEGALKIADKVIVDNSSLTDAYLKAKDQVSIDRQQAENEAAGLSAVRWDGGRRSGRSAQEGELNCCRRASCAHVSFTDALDISAGIQ